MDIKVYVVGCCEDCGRTYKAYIKQDSAVECKFCRNMSVNYEDRDSVMLLLGAKVASV